MLSNAYNDDKVNDTVSCACNACVRESRYLASGSGDTTVRFWDIDTETPHHCCRGQFGTHVSLFLIFRKPSYKESYDDLMTKVEICRH